MHPLLDLIGALHLAGGLFLEARFTAPWCVASRVRPQHYAGMDPPPAHVIAYHYVLEGRCVLEVDGHPATDVRAGEIILLPRNDLHRLGSAPKLRPVDADRLLQPGAGDGLARVDHGGGGDCTRLLCGFLATHSPSPALTSLLPVALTIAVDELTAGAWIESTFRFAAQALVAPRPGAPGMAAKLAELLFAEAVTRHLAVRAGEDRGWINGLRDPVVGRALGLLHARLDHGWTVAELAREVGASRSALADRFTRLVGQSPMRYLARERLRAAAQRLRDGLEPVAAVAFAAGYESEAAFGRAFKREFGTSPAAWRKAAPRA